MNITNINGKITVNGKSYTGRSVSVINNTVIIDGKAVNDSSGEKNINITITGDCGDIVNESGDVQVLGKVNGSIKCGAGNVNANDVGGSIKSAAGNIQCGSVGGSVETTVGNIAYIKG
jgi:hypothetical protein